MMKLGFSSRVCPEWDLETMVNKASALGYDGIELFGLRGELHLPSVAELADRPDDARALFQDKKVELVCLSTAATLDVKGYVELKQQKAAIAETVGLAARLGCPYVRMSAGKTHGFWDTERLAMSRIGEALGSLVPLLSRHGVTLLVENGGDFVQSHQLWFLVDTAGHPAIQACWNQCQAMTRAQRATNAIPQMGSRLGMVHLCDATFDENFVLVDYKPLGEGNTEIAKQIDLLKGMVYEGYAVVHWPDSRGESLPDPETALSDAGTFVRACVDAKQTVLTAYKGDKKAPKLAARAGAVIAE